MPASPAESCKFRTLLIQPGKRMTLIATLTARNGPEPEAKPSSERGEPSLMGFESCRKELWGSHTARELGLTLVPTLATQDIYAFESDLSRLRDEAQILMGNLRKLKEGTPYSESSIGFWLENMLAWVDLAESYHDDNIGVYIG